VRDYKLVIESTMVLLHRVASKLAPPRWMVSTKPFTDSRASLKLRPVKNAALLESDPCAWKEQQQDKVDMSQDEVEVHYSQLVAPLQVRPPFVYGLGLNYASHSAETKMDVPKLPIVIGKAPTGLIGPSQSILIPKVCQELEVDFEVELAIVIGKECKNVSKADALNYVFGYTCANDVSARRWQGKKGGGQWTRAKSFDTFLPVGPSILLENATVDPQAMTIQTKVAKKGTHPQTMQNANTKDMIFGVAALVEFLSQDTTLLPWTLILTGTPAGVGYTRQPPVYLEAGDTVQVEIDTIGALFNPVGASE